MRLLLVIAALTAIGCDSPTSPTQYRPCPVRQVCDFGPDTFCYDGIGYRACR